MENYRRIVVDGVSYGWRVTDTYVRGRGHRTKFLAFREGTTDSALRLSFADGPTGDHHEHEMPHLGLVVLAATARHFNLNHPSVVAAVIRRAVERGWSDAPMTIDDGFTLLAELPAPEAEHVR